MQAAVVGVPGTGKTFFMVSYLKKYFTYDPFFREYEIKSNVLIITNIAELKFYGASCWNVESPEILGNPSEGITGRFTREEFFTVKNFQRIMEETGKKNIILALDEVQKDHYFPLGYKDPDVLFFFAYHRHIGVDILLGTQDAALISRSVLAQCEYLAHGALRSKKIMGAMSYKFTDNRGNYMYSKTLRADPEVFSAYQSASVDEVHKPKNAILHWAIVGFVFLLVAGGTFKLAIGQIKDRSKQSSNKAQKNAPVSVSSASVSSPSPVPVQKPISSSCVPFASVSSIPVDVPAPVFVGWRVYPVDGYIRDGQMVRYMVRGKVLNSRLCRNYSSDLKQVEYFGPPIPENKPVSNTPVIEKPDTDTPDRVVAEMNIDLMRSQLNK